MTEQKTVYPAAEPSPSFPKIEEAIGAWWKENGIFERSIAQRRDRGASEFVFYDGPPFANGLPHYGHLVTGFVKDLVPRYQTMRGKVVDRRFGWDCHGLPAELQSEKELGVSGRLEILKYGVARFNEHCRTSVQQFTSDWEYYVTRSARWVDFENDYKTMDLSFMESTMWAFKQLHDKGLIYEGYRVVPYSWAAQTPLSNFETRLDNSYRMRQDPALTVGFTLDPLPGEVSPTRLVAWTTTPWTLPSNMALAVAPDADYAVLEKHGERVIVGAPLVVNYARELEGFVEVATLKGADLVGRTYQPLFPFFEAERANGAFRVHAGSFIEMTDGTGVVHIAPAFGEDDMALAQANGIPVVDPVDFAGNFTDLVPVYAGTNVFEANKDVIRDLKHQAGVVLRHETYDHNYPHCWRTDQPLIYKALRSWYVKVTAFKDRMVELNQGITWVPEHIRDGLFGKWLENARDWNIGRNRFWGSPIPVWKSDDPNYPRLDVYGSLDEIERDFGVRPHDLHRPYIDDLTRPNPDDPTGKSVMRRVEDVLDCWFESGSMPFAQVHYPFENKDWFENHFPGDFIVEYVAQTRGWFYTLMVMSTALFDKAPFRSVVCHGVVLDESKQKLSKRLKNYPDPIDVFNTYGADALRWYLVSSPLLSGGDLAMPKDGRAIAETVRQVMLPIWNAYSFFTLYANIDGLKGRMVTTADAELDRYMLAKTADLIRGIEAAMEKLDLAGATNAFPPFIEALNNWFIRRSRERFWKGEKDVDKQAAYDTLYTVLVTMTRALAPFLPYLAEHIHRALVDGESVHLADWPDASAFDYDAALVERMDLARAVASAAASIRTVKNLRTRQPLTTLTVAHPTDVDQLIKVQDLLKDEANVKNVVFSTTPSDYGHPILTPNLPVVGKRLGAALRNVIAAAKAGEWKLGADEAVEVGGVVLAKGEYFLKFQANDGVDAAPFDGSAGVVVLDTHVDEALEREGIARDFIRLVQVARKEAGFQIADRIHIEVRIANGLGDVLVDHAETIRAETLAETLRPTDDQPEGFVSETSLLEQPIEIGVRVAR
ncbi:isoleucine--tRNA ligase [Kaistia dalseonensis]|uniref:Isoleucine--tRNA ligase n=1 Tax=Kaistia dalseonensis TaxID=410840 RepID=A0ABU0HDA9_9HYPH|nr:isoleucine--tRNA ligase [Kaistia dalseonensis]MCX5496885.1 isoleucine--tRNA ligase [Kaistia dalseonensis]MDQ0439511.1 isoleucyl-tRNA synthetase [Kaistia dalseonensis]